LAALPFIGVLGWGDVTCPWIIPRSAASGRQFALPPLDAFDREQSRQEPPAAADAAHDGADRRRRDPRDLPVLQTMHVMELDCLGELLGDRPQRLAQLAGLEPRQQVVEGRRRVAGDHLLVRSFQLGDEDQPLPSRAVPASLVGHGAEDLAEPGKSRIHVAELIEGCPGAQVGLLHVVLRLVPVCPARGHGHQSIEMRQGRCLKACPSRLWLHVSSRNTTFDDRTGWTDNQECGWRPSAIAWCRRRASTHIPNARRGSRLAEPEVEHPYAGVRSAPEVPAGPLGSWPAFSASMSVRPVPLLECRSPAAASSAPCNEASSKGRRPRLRRYTPKGCVTVPAPPASVVWQIVHRGAAGRSSSRWMAAGKSGVASSMTARRIGCIRGTRSVE